MPNNTGGVVLKKIAIVGAGNLGKVLGCALKERGYEIVAATALTEKSRLAAAELFNCPVYKEPEKAAEKADIIFLTTPDGVIEEVSTRIAEFGGIKRGQVVVHTSGAHSSAVLSSAKSKGSSVISIHPLQTFPELQKGLDSLPGTFFAVEGDEDAFSTAEEIIESLQGRMLSIPTEMKPLYHAAACVACNYFVSLIDIALRLYEPMGVPKNEVVQALYPLIEATLRNVKHLGPEKALTGPIARGDFSTVEVHIKQISTYFPHLLPFYKQLGLYTAELASRKGTISEEDLKIMKNLLGGE